MPPLAKQVRRGNLDTVASVDYKKLSDRLMKKSL